MPVNYDNFGLQENICIWDNVSYDGKDDASAVEQSQRSASWFIDRQHSAPRMQYCEILTIVSDASAQVFVLLTLTLMADSAGREYWDGRIIGNNNDIVMGKSAQNALALLNEEVAIGGVRCSPDEDDSASLIEVVSPDRKRLFPMQEELDTLT
ncbi:MAG: hypothetical protein WCG83_01100 [Candidatus Peregrinibacteria bacterium]